MASTLSTAVGPVAGRTALTGVRVFDGQRLTEPRTVVIDGAVIGSDSSGAREIDAAGAVLLAWTIARSSRRLRGTGVPTRSRSMLSSPQRMREASRSLCTQRAWGPSRWRSMAAGQRIAVPTLITMQAHAAVRPGTSFAAATDTVAALHAAGVTILAGSDAVTSPGMPVQVPHGESLHQELELLVAAGLSSADALRSATSLPARAFGLRDRGAVEPGLRADLVLIDGDPLEDIRATRSIRRIWCGGIEHASG